MENLIELRDSWWWPKYDTACWKFLSRRQYVPKDVSAFCPNKGTVIQAGGNAGMYVKFYSEIFNTVYTFEPDPINFYCLAKNTPENVIKFQGCVGNTANLVNLSYSELHPKKPNSGGFRVSGEGNIPTFIIDHFNFKTVDLIHLDIEGYELFALQGSIETIKRCKPIIALELNGLAEKFNHTDHDVILFLRELGYEKINVVDDDVIFQHTGITK